MPRRPLYARVDGVIEAGRFVVMEVELNEPRLGFADALLARLR